MAGNEQEQPMTSRCPHPSSSSLPSSPSSSATASSAFSDHLSALVLTLGLACQETARVVAVAVGPEQAAQAQTLRASTVYLLGRAEQALSLAENGPEADRRVPVQPQGPAL